MIDGNNALEFTEIDEQEQQAKNYVIDNDGAANWALQKIAAIDREHARLSEDCQAIIDFQEQRMDEFKRKAENERGYFIGLLAQYIETEQVKPFIKTTKTRATYQLPNGKLVKKLENTTLECNKDVLLEALKDTEYIENKPNLKWGEYKKTLSILGNVVVDSNGEIVEGVNINIVPARFDVEAI